MIASELDLFRKVVFAFFEKKGLDKKTLCQWDVDYGQDLSAELSCNLSSFVCWLDVVLNSIEKGDGVAEKAALIQCYAYSQMLASLFEEIKDDLDKMAFGDFGLPDVPEGYEHPDCFSLKREQ